MIAKAFFIGRLTKDPELRSTQNGKPYVMFTIAFNKSYDRNNPETVFLQCSAWNQLAENLARFQKKGSLIAVDAVIDSYKREQDQYASIIFRAINIQFLERRSSQSFDSNSVNSNANNNYSANSANNNSGNSFANQASNNKSTVINNKKTSNNTNTQKNKLGIIWED